MFDLVFLGAHEDGIRAELKSLSKQGAKVISVITLGTITSGSGNYFAVVEFPAAAKAE